MTDVKTARDVLADASWGQSRPEKLDAADNCIAALTATGYQITPVRADDGVRVEAALEAIAIMRDAAKASPFWNDETRAAFERTVAPIERALAAADVVAGAGRDGTVTIGFHPKEARFASAACRAEADRAVDPNDCVLLHIIADEIDAALAPAAGEVRL